FSSSSASTNLSSVIGSSRVLQVEVFQLHLSRLGPMATSTTPQPYTADRPENSTTSVDANGLDEILAEDFLCSNPDGSLVDKNQFLAQTARPVTISGLSVHEVRVRILGDIAIIHARTRYTTADGEQRNGRYTDVWARRDGKWLAVSAHVTR